MKILVKILVKIRETVRDLTRRSTRRRRISPAALGRRGEESSRKYLEAAGYRIVAGGFTAPIGRSRRGRPVKAEIDLLAWDESTSPATLVFIEVKTRRDATLVRPEAAVDQRKRRHLTRIARICRRHLAVEELPFRFDVIAITWPAGGRMELTHLQSYFKAER
jgi:putative endonuclease